MCSDLSESLLSRSSVSRPAAGSRPTEDLQETGGQRGLTAQVDGFAREAIDAEATRLGVPVGELITFSVLYYLADIDSGRIARQIAMSPYPGASR